MEKVLVEIISPAADAVYDVFIPLESKMNEVKTLLASVLSDLSNGKYKAADDAVVCDAISGKILDVNMTVYELNIRNGSKLMLI